MDTWIQGGLLITAEESYQADIGIENGRIAEVGPGRGGSAEQVLDARGKWIFPGIIDAHTHMELPLAAAVSADDFTSGTRAAACGGVTTIIDFSLHRRGVSLAVCLRDRRQAADEHVAIDYGLHAEIIDPCQDILEEIPLLVGEGITSFKLFLAYQRDGRMVSDDGLRDVLQRAREAGGLVLVHAENGPLVEQLTDHLV
ncbi:amidohydrolase family protein, partial [Candidatus Zixiibacteriota bacterium]